jgi:hypothetical protein
VQVNEPASVDHPTIHQRKPNTHPPDDDYCNSTFVDYLGLDYLGDILATSHGRVFSGSRNAIVPIAATKAGISLVCFYERDGL